MSEESQETIRKQFGQLMREVMAEDSIKRLEKRLIDFQKKFEQAFTQRQEAVNLAENQTQDLQARVAELRGIQEKIHEGWEQFIAKTNALEDFQNLVKSQMESRQKAVETLDGAMNRHGVALTDIANTSRTLESKLSLAQNQIDALHAQAAELGRKINVMAVENVTRPGRKTKAPEPPKKRKRGRPRKEK